MGGLRISFVQSGSKRDLYHRPQHAIKLGRQFCLFLMVTAHISQRQYINLPWPTIFSYSVSLRIRHTDSNHLMLGSLDRYPGPINDAAMKCSERLTSRSQSRTLSRNTCTHVLKPSSPRQFRQPFGRVAFAPSIPKYSPMMTMRPAFLLRAEHMFRSPTLEPKSLRFSLPPAHQK